MMQFRRPQWLSDPRAQMALIVSLLVLIAGLSYPIYTYLDGSWHWRKALKAIEAHDFPAARMHLEFCRREWPRSGETAFLAARTARRAGDLVAASRLLAEARRLEWVPELIDLETSLISVQTGEYEPHIIHLLSCIKVNHPDSILILEVLEPAAMRSLDLPLVQECLELWVNLEPTKAGPFMDRGDLKERYRNLSGALDDYQTAFQNEPGNVEVRHRLGRLLVDLNRPAEALPHFEWLLERDAANPKTRLGLARCHFSMGQPAVAKSILEGLLKDEPKYGNAMALYGSLEMDAGRAAEAETWFRKALRNMPAEVEVTYQLYVCLNAQGKTAEAEATKKQMDAAKKAQAEVAEYMKQITKNKSDPEPIRQVAARMIEFGLEDEAKRWLELALKRDPRDAATYKLFADYYKKIGDPIHEADYLKIYKSLSSQPK